MINAGISFHRPDAIRECHKNASHADTRISKFGIINMTRLNSVATT